MIVMLHRCFEQSVFLILGGVHSDPHPLVAHVVPLRCWEAAVPPPRGCSAQDPEQAKATFDGGGNNHTPGRPLLLPGVLWILYLRSTTFWQKQGFYKKIIRPPMALRIGLPGSSALQNDGLDVPIILQCRTPRETNPKGHWVTNYFCIKSLLLLPPCTQSWYTQSYDL